MVFRVLSDIQNDPDPIENMPGITMSLGPLVGSAVCGFLVNSYGELVYLSEVDLLQRIDLTLLAPQSYLLRHHSFIQVLA